MFLFESGGKSFFQHESAVAKAMADKLPGAKYREFTTKASSSAKAMESLLILPDDGHLAGPALHCQ